MERPKHLEKESPKDFAEQARQPGFNFACPASESHNPARIHIVSSAAFAATNYTGNHLRHTSGEAAFFTKQLADEWDCSNNRDRFLKRVEAVRTTKRTHGNNPQQSPPTDQRLRFQIFGAESAFPSCSLIG